MAKRIIKVNLDNSVVSLIVENPDEFDTEDILRIDYSNIIGELLTFPVIVNRVGILRADAENRVRSKKLEVDIYRADLSERFRKELSSIKVDNSGTRKVVRPVNDAVNNTVEKDEGMRLKMNELMRAERDFAYIDSFYWGVKSKDSKLKAISGHVPMDFESDIVCAAINGVNVKKSEKPFGIKR